MWLLMNLSKLRTNSLMLQKPSGDCVFKLDNFVETSRAQGLILLAAGVARELAASMWRQQGSLEHLHSLQAELSSVARRMHDGLFYLGRQQSLIYSSLLCINVSLEPADFSVWQRCITGNDHNLMFGLASLTTQLLLQSKNQISGFQLPWDRLSLEPHMPAINRISLQGNRKSC